MGSNADTHAPVAARLGYNGQLHEPMGGWQALGNGHRIYNPVLMRFHSPDALSPFDRGGINAYAYCGDDPVNRVDPSGRISIKLMSVGLIFTGLTAALGASLNYVHPEDKQTRSVIAFAMIVSALGAATVGGTYIYKKRHSKRPLKPAAEEAIQPTTPPLTPQSTSPPTKLPHRVTFAPEEQVTATSRVGTSRVRRYSDSDIGPNAGPAGRRRVDFEPITSQAAPAAVSGARSGRRLSVVTAGYKRTPPKGADKRARNIRGPHGHRMSINSSYTAI